MADKIERMKLVIEIDDRLFRRWKNIEMPTVEEVRKVQDAFANGTPLPKGHGRLKDEDEVIKAIEDRVEFLRKNDAVFMRLRKDIDILGCIPKIRTEVPTIIEADEDSEE